MLEKYIFLDKLYVYLCQYMCAIWLYKTQSESRIKINLYSPKIFNEIDKNKYKITVKNKYIKYLEVLNESNSIWWDTKSWM